MTSLNFQFRLFHMSDTNLSSSRQILAPILKVIHVEIRPMPRRGRKLDKPECTYNFWRVSYIHVYDCILHVLMN